MVNAESGIVQRFTKPALLFAAVVLFGAAGYWWFEEMTVAIDSELDGCAVYEANTRGATGANIVAVRQRTGKLLAAPTRDTHLQAGDIVVALGTRAQLVALREKTH